MTMGLLSLLAQAGNGGVATPGLLIAVAGLVGMIATALGAFLIARHKGSGRVATTEANEVFAEMRDLLTRYKDDVREARAETAALRVQLVDASGIITGLRGELVDVRGEAVELRNEMSAVRVEMTGLRQVMTSGEAMSQRAAEAAEGATAAIEEQAHG